MESSIGMLAVDIPATFVSPVRFRLSERLSMAVGGAFLDAGDRAVKGSNILIWRIEDQEGEDGGEPRPAYKALVRDA